MKNGTSNILIYEVPKSKICSDDSNCTKELIRMRDSIGAQYVPGPEEGMYMITSTAFAPTYKKTVINNYPIIEDPTRDRCIVIEGFIAAPGTSKRDLLFELETIIKSIKFIN